VLSSEGIVSPARVTRFERRHAMGLHRSIDTMGESSGAEGNGMQVTGGSQVHTHAGKKGRCNARRGWRHGHHIARLQRARRKEGVQFMPGPDRGWGECLVAAAPIDTCSAALSNDRLATKRAAAGSEMPLSASAQKTAAQEALPCFALTEEHEWRQAPRSKPPLLLWQASTRQKVVQATACYV
jgi:hypothetical protein